MTALLDAVESATSDKELFDSVSAVVAIKKKRQSEFFENSFILHAPLELSARYFLLPLVKDSHAQAARDRIKMIARRYDKYEDDDQDNYDFSPKDIGLWSRSLTSAGHSTILLALLEVLDESNDSLVQILNNMNHLITFDSEARIKDVSKGDTTEDSVSDWLSEKIANVRKIGGGADTIAGSIRSGEDSGIVGEAISEWKTFDLTDDDIVDHIYPVLMRITAMSMLKEDESESKYGWTHAMTIPHSHYVLSKYFGLAQELVISSLTYIVSYRSIIGKEKILTSDFQEYLDEDEEGVFTSHLEEMTDIISQACVLEDAHLVKYVYTNFDVMKRDPQYSALYIAAAKKLLTIWSTSS